MGYLMADVMPKMKMMRNADAMVSILSFDVMLHAAKMKLSDEAPCSQGRWNRER